MRSTTPVLGLLSVVLACGLGDADPRGDAESGSANPGDAVLYEGARLIVGDGGRIENSAFLIEGGRFGAVGRAGEIATPPGADRVDLSGTTVIPAMIDAHAHLGYEGYTSWGAENYTRDNVVEHLHRYAYYGFGAVYSTGTDPRDVALAVQREQDAGRIGGARLLFAAGLAPPGQGPNASMLEEIAKLTEATGEPILGAAGAEEEGRRAVREIADRGIRFAKIWVDDRGGSQEKLRPAVYRAIVDEAGVHDIDVHAHQQSARDMNDLLRAGVAGFLHGRFGPVMDEELARRMKERGAFLVPNQGLRERRRWRVSDDPFFAETVPSEVVERLRETNDDGGGPAPGGRPEVRAAFQRLVSADVPMVLGTDAGAVPDHFFGYSGHRELEIYTRMGMTPMQAIVAATGRPAEHLGLTERGTVAPGRSADFVVLDANPLEDIRNTREISKVYLRGEEIDREGLRTGWTDS